MIKILDNFSSKQKNILILVALVAILGFIYFIYNSNSSSNNISLEEDILISNDENTINSTSLDENIVVVHITGSVKNPGIVKLPDGSRIEDAIYAAGGLTENADISNVNLAYILDDGIKIIIPSILDENIEESDIFIENSGENIIEDNDIFSNNKNKALNINKASESELGNLPGIGPTLATKIVEYREEHGKFKSIEDIKNVNGIGNSKYENIKNLICV